MLIVISVITGAVVSIPEAEVVNVLSLDGLLPEVLVLFPEASADLTRK